MVEVQLKKLNKKQLEAVERDRWTVLRNNFYDN